MLHRGNSDAAKRLRRAKSTSSVTTRTTPRNSATFDPVLEHEKAVTAAIRAYEHANGPMPVAATSVSSKQNGTLRRQGSYLARHNSGARSKTKVESPRSSKSQQISQTCSTKTTGSTATSTPTAGRPSAIHHTTSKDFGAHQTAVPLQHQKENSDGSRTKLRKARSSFIPSSQTPQSGSYDTGRHIFDDMTTSSIGSGFPRATREQLTDDAILAMARERYLQDFQDQAAMSSNSRQVRSSMLVPFTSRLRKSKRESIQSDSTFSQESMVLEVRKPASGATSMTITENKGRRISMSLKRGLRRAFGRSSDSSSYELPPQQVEAARPHYGDLAFRRQNNSSPFAINPDPAEYYETANTLKLPPRFWEDDRLVLADRSSDQSLRHSQTSSHPTRSRVTSWNDSSRDNTVALAEVGQLPSIIESPERRQISQVPSIHDSAHVEQGKADAHLRKSSSRFSLAGGVDSRRLLTTLKKHVSMVKEKEKSDDTRTASVSTAGSWRPSSPPLQHQPSRQSKPLHSEPLASTIRDVSREYPSQYLGVSTDGHSNKPPSPPDARTVSTYSAQFSQAPLNGDKSLTPTGSAVVTESRPVSRWALGRSIMESATYKPNTSNEWRSFAAEATAELDAGPLPSTNTEDVQKTHREPSYDTKLAARFNLMQATKSTEAIVEGTTRRRRNIFDDLPRISNKKFDHMNDRFPMLATSRKTSKSSLAPSYRTPSTQAQPNQEERSSSLVAGSMTDEAPKQSQFGIASKRSNIPLRSSQGNVISNVAGQREISNLTKFSHTNDMVGSTKHRHVESQLHEVPSINSLRNHVATSSNNNGVRLVAKPTHLDENFLLRIRRGPYGPPSSSPSKNASSSVDSFDLLAGRRAFGSAAGRGGGENTSPSSRGQRMVDDYLGGRSVRELDVLGGSSPVFL